MPVSYSMEDVIDLCNIFEEIDGSSLSENEVNSQEKDTPSIANKAKLDTSCCVKLDDYTVCSMSFDMEDVIDLCNICEEIDGDSLSENEPLVKDLYISIKDEVMDWVYNFYHLPQSFQHLCRIPSRRTCDTCLHNILDNLNAKNRMPTGFVAYLLMKDILNQ